MHPLLFSTTTITTMRSSSSATSSSSSSSTKPKHSNHNHHHNHPNCTVLCKHSPSATLDLLILVLVLFSGTFLITSYFSYIFNSLSLLVLSSPHLRHFPIAYAAAFVLFFAASVAAVELCCGARSRKCDRKGCKGLKKAMEFDLQLQTEECVKTGGSSSVEIDRLPWKGGTETNSDYECLRAELRKMAPPNGRAVLLFRARCGCPVAKLQGWGPKRSRRHKKALAGMIPNGRDNR